MDDDAWSDGASSQPRGGNEAAASSSPHSSALPVSGSAWLDGPQPQTPSRSPQRNMLPRCATVHADGSTPRPTMLDRLGSFRSVTSAALPSAPSGLEDAPSSEATDWRATAVGATPLDRTIDQIGMGRYQWTVLVLSGLGWAADNMWIQAVAIILPHVQRTFAVTDTVVGLASSSIFVGMFVGSLVWGTVSDTFGRRAAFNTTLFVTAVFGFLSALSPAFYILCLLLFCVGTGVGGSMPTDSSNLVENLPVRKHSYVTALSFFFSAGAVVPSTLGLVLLADKEGPGWRWLLTCLAVVTILFVACRVVFFRLLESPKYLVHAGRPEEAREILQRIQRYNGGAAVTIKLRDVYDVATPHLPTSSAGPSASRGSSERPRQPESPHVGSKLRSNQKSYDSLPSLEDDENLDAEEDERLLGRSEARGHESAYASDADAPPRAAELPRWLGWLPRQWHATTAGLLSRYAELLSDEWRQTTVLVWIIWGGMSFAFTSFNVFLPKLLEERHGAKVATPLLDGDSNQAAMVDYLIYTVSSLPGSLVSAYLVDTRLGRIGTMTVSTALTCISVLVFALSSWRASLTLISIASSISYAAIYGYTPEVMGPQIRGTACGLASAISRVAGIIAPIVAGRLFSWNNSLPLYLATIVFAGVSVAMAMLPIETRRGAGSSGGDEEGEEPVVVVAH
ncbi:hypothetical protein ACQY0O_000116 [Thecaphora frezii]